MTFPGNLVLIRHAEDESKPIMRALDLNPYDKRLARKLGSKKDWNWPLTPHGKNESLRVGPLYRDLLPFNVVDMSVLVSPIPRACETAFNLTRS